MERAVDPLDVALKLLRDTQRHGLSMGWEKQRDEFLASLAPPEPLPKPWRVAPRDNKMQLMWIVVAADAEVVAEFVREKDAAMFVEFNSRG